MRPIANAASSRFMRLAPNAAGNLTSHGIGESETVCAVRASGVWLAGR